MQKITPFLWFDDQAEEAAQFYVSVFNDGRIIETRRFRGPHGEQIGAVTLEIDGQQIIAFNGGPDFKFNEAISLFVRCETQAEVDALWDRLCEGGAPGPCGWLKDKYGVSWQIVPTALGDMLQDPDPAKASRTMQAMLQMTKLDIAALKAAYDG